MSVDNYNGVVEIFACLKDHEVILPSNPYDARNLEDALRDFLDKYFNDAYSEGQASEYEAGYEHGYDSGYDSGYEVGYEDAARAVRAALDL